MTAAICRLAESGTSQIRTAVFPSAGGSFCRRFSVTCKALSSGSPGGSRPDGPRLSVAASLSRADVQRTHVGPCALRVFPLRRNLFANVQTQIHKGRPSACDVNVTPAPTLGRPAAVSSPAGSHTPRLVPASGRLDLLSRSPELRLHQTTV